MSALKEAKAEPLRLDLACGTRKHDGFLGVDIRQFRDGCVDLVADLKASWPWADDSVDEAVCAHYIEHLTALERAFFVNELHRVLKPGGKAVLKVPYWRSARAYGDPTHQWPPVTEFWMYYLNAAWRKTEAPHLDCFTCDFDITAGYVLHPEIQARNHEFQMFAVRYYSEAALELHFNLTKR